MLTGEAYIANVTFAYKPVNESFFGEQSLSLRLGGNNMLDLITNLNLTEMKQRLTDL